MGEIFVRGSFFFLGVMLGFLVIALLTASQR